jgi:glycerol kinase
MLYNIKSMSWDDQLLSHLQVPKSMMPQVIPSNGQFGEMNEKLLGFKAPIRANLGDQQAALFGQCCFDVGMGKCTYGTGSFLLTNIGSEAKLVPGLLTTLAWQLEGKPPTYAFEGAIFVAGAAIQWLRDGLGIIESSAETQKLAESLASNEGVFFVPAFVGLGSPYWNSDVRGTITGLTRGTTRAHLARAALESMAFQIADVAKGMSENGIELKELRVDGGATRNDFMVQFQADLLKVPVIRSAQTESTAWGVGALAALSCGLVKDFAELSADWQLDSKIMPKEDRSTDYKGWQAALKGALAVAEAEAE